MVQVVTQIFAYRSLQQRYAAQLWRSFCLNYWHCRAAPLIQKQRLNSYCKSGPKSGHSACLRLSSHYCILLVIWMTNLAAAANVMPIQSELSGGEGCLDESWIKTEADFNAATFLQFLTANTHDKALPMGYGLENDRKQRTQLSSVQKRSYKRAIRRAQQSGSAWYRGKCMTLDQVAPGPRPTAQFRCKPPKQTPVSHPQAPRHRMQIGHVNVGGLAQERLHEIKLWARQTELDILLLSETRWSFAAEWSDRWWYHIHTGSDTDRADGLPFLIRKSLCRPDQIGFTAPIQGRLGHLRLHLTSTRDPWTY